MSNDPVDIADQISKLLAHVHSPTANVHEAENAMLLAQKLASKHGVDLADIQDGHLSTASRSKAKAKILEAVAMDNGSDFSNWRMGLCVTVAENFRCRTLFYEGEEGGPFAGMKQMTIIGTEQDLEIVGRVLMFAIDIALNNVARYIHSLALGFVPNSAMETVKRQWLEGYVVGIKAKFQHQSSNDPGVALMVVSNPDVDEYIAGLEDVQTEKRSFGGEDTGATWHGIQGYHTGRNSATGLEIEITGSVDPETEAQYIHDPAM